MSLNNKSKIKNNSTNVNKRLEEIKSINEFAVKKNYKRDIKSKIEFIVKNNYNYKTDNFIISERSKEKLEEGETIIALRNPIYDKYNGYTRTYNINDLIIVDVKMDSSSNQFFFRISKEEENKNEDNEDNKDNSDKFRFAKQAFISVITDSNFDNLLKKKTIMIQKEKENTNKKRVIKKMILSHPEKQEQFKSMNIWLIKNYNTLIEKIESLEKLRLKNINTDKLLKNNEKLENTILEIKMIAEQNDRVLKDYLGILRKLYTLHFKNNLSNF